MANIVTQQGPAMKMSLAMEAYMNLKKLSPISISQMKRWTHVLSIMCVISLYFGSSQLMTYCDQEKSVTRFFVFLWSLLTLWEKRNNFCLGIHIHAHQHAIFLHSVLKCFIHYSPGEHFGEKSRFSGVRLDSNMDEWICHNLKHNLMYLTDDKNITCLGPPGPNGPQITVNVAMTLQCTG